MYHVLQCHTAVNCHETSEYGQWRGTNGNIHSTILVSHRHSLQQFEEALNYIANKGYARMMPEEEKDWIELMNVIHDSVKGGMKYNTGTLLMVLSRPLASSHIASTMTVGSLGGAGELKPQHKGKTPSKDLRNP